MTKIKHNRRCSNAKLPKKYCKCKCKGMLHGDKNKYNELNDKWE